MQQREDLQGIVTYVSKAQLLRESDVISLHVDLNPTSVGLLTAKDFAQMKPESYLVNASRGPVINTDDLIVALENGPIAAVALDTVEGESAVFNHDLSTTGVPDSRIAKLLAMPNVLITPHVAFFTNIAVKNMVDIALQDTLTILTNQTSEHEI